MNTNADFTTEDLGTILVITPTHEAARSWLHETTDVEGWMAWGSGFAFDAGMGQAVLQSIHEENLSF